MKKILYAAGAMMMAMAAVSCSVDENKLEQPGLVKDGARLCLSGEAFMGGTKVSIGEKDSGVYPLLWGIGDVISISSRDTSAAGAIVDERAELFEETAGLSSGVFQTYNEVSLDKSGDIVVVYPGTSVTYGDGKLRRNLPEAQEQRSAGSSIHVGNYALSYAEATLEAGQKEDVKFTLSQKTAFVKLMLSTSEYSSLDLVGAQLYSPGSKLCGDLVYDIDSKTLSVDNAKESVGAKFRSPVKFDGVKELYFTAAPADLTGKDTYVVITMSDEARTVTIPAKVTGGKLQEGCLTVITVSDISAATNGCKWFEPVETRYIANYGAGWSYGASNTILMTEDSEPVYFDFKARGSFIGAKEPKKIKLFYGSDMNAAHRTFIQINGTPGHDGSDYVTFDLDDNYAATIKANKTAYPGYMAALLVLDANDQTIWGTNIWYTPEVNELQYKNGRVLDRNLGTGNTGDFNNWWANGSHFQWGRPFAFGWAAATRTTAPCSNVTSLSVSAEHPYCFYYYKGVTPSINDWYYGNGTGSRENCIDDLWGNPNMTTDKNCGTAGTKSIYDPCPKGYMVVSPAILDEVESNFEIGSAMNGNTEYRFVKYCYDGTNYDSWAFARYRNGNDAGGPASNNIRIAAYWSNSTVTSYEGTSKDARCMFFDAGNPDGGVEGITGPSKYSNGRSAGFAVRCMKDTENR
ncbi:MAG: hypothetical protein NC308_00165 [Clostridium sp.]|nr:hypothetical protein [Bacteroides sp.]MCM1197280.1 hypothetical protein [Clostridium sp.]